MPHPTPCLLEDLPKIPVAGSLTIKCEGSSGFPGVISGGDQKLEHLMVLPNIQVSCLPLVLMLASGFSIPVTRSLPEEPLTSHLHRNPVQWDLQARPSYPALSNHWSTPLRSSPVAQSPDAQFRLQKYSLWEASSPSFRFSGLHECSSNFSTRRSSCLLLINTQWLAHVAGFFSIVYVHVLVVMYVFAYKHSHAKKKNLIVHTRALERSDGP